MKRGIDATTEKKNTAALRFPWGGEFYPRSSAVRSKTRSPHACCFRRCVFLFPYRGSEGLVSLRSSPERRRDRIYLPPPLSSVGMMQYLLFFAVLTKACKALCAFVSDAGKSCLLKNVFVRFFQSQKTLQALQEIISSVKTTETAYSNDPKHCKPNLKDNLDIQRLIFIILQKINCSSGGR